MNREFSAGGIVFNNQNQVLVRQGSRSKFWSFPKGHLDPGETTKQAALREVKEETGVKAKIIKKIGQSQYIYSLNQEKVFKIVTLYLMEYISGDIKDHDWETQEVRWLKPEEALELLTYKNDKELLQKALQLKNNLPDA